MNVAFYLLLGNFILDGENMSNTILLVEDNPMAVELIISAFNDKETDNSIHMVQSGEEAIDYLFGNNKYSARNIYPIPSIILLDLKMTGIDGFDVLKKIKNTPVLKRIPIIIFSSSKNNDDIKKCFDLGANSYIRKPISFEDLIDTIESINTYWNTINVFPVNPRDKLSMF